MTAQLRCTIRALSNPIRWKNGIVQTISNDEITPEINPNVMIVFFTFVSSDI